MKVCSGGRIYLSPEDEDFGIFNSLDMPANASNLDHFAVLVDGMSRCSGGPTSDANGVVTKTGNLWMAVRQPTEE